MNLDEYGLPKQANEEWPACVGDQAQRTGMIATAGALYKDPVHGPLMDRCDQATLHDLQPAPGIYTRYVGADPSGMSADQLIPIIANHVVRGRTKQVFRIWWRMVMRGGFAQNNVDSLSAEKRKKIPDFMAIRAAPLFARMHPLLYPLAYICDMSLLLSALGGVWPLHWHDDTVLPVRRSPSESDDNNLIVTMVTCRVVMPTFISRIAARLYGKYRPWNYGCAESVVDNHGRLVPYKSYAYPAVIGALRWYHHSRHKGNPEIAEMWIPLVRRYILGSK